MAVTLSIGYVFRNFMVKLRSPEYDLSSGASVIWQILGLHFGQSYRLVRLSLSIRRVSTQNRCHRKEHVQTHLSSIQRFHSTCLWEEQPRKQKTTKTGHFGHSKSIKSVNIGNWAC